MGFSEINNSSYPEFEVLTLCGSKTNVERLERLLNEDLSWPLLTRLSAYHAVYPLLYQTLSTVESPRIPGIILKRFHQSFYNTAAHNLLLIKELGRVIQILASSDIPLIAFKGPVLAQVAYKNLGLRPCTDIDIWVPEEKFGDVKALLLDDGYRSSGKIESMSRFRKALHLYLSQQSPFVRDRIYGLDVHKRLMPPGYHYNPSFEELLQRSQEIAIAGIVVPSFAPEDLLLILCYHGAKNRWERLKHICDVAELIRAKPDLDWDVVIERAVATRGLRILSLGLYLVHKLLDVQVPEEVLKRIRADKQVTNLGLWVITRLPEQMRLGIAPYKERVSLHLKLQDHVFGKVRYGFYSLLRQIDD